MPKQIVPPFSKKEIEQIAQEVVDSKEAPSGGTQLYKHQLTINLDGSNTNCIIYSLNGNSLAGTSPGSLITTNYVSGLIDPEGYNTYVPILTITHTSECMLVYVDDYGNLQTGAFSSISADTVTEL